MPPINFVVSIFLFVFLTDISCSVITGDTEILSMIKELKDTVTSHEHAIRSLKERVAEQENVIITLKDKDKQQQDAINYLMNELILKSKQNELANPPKEQTLRLTKERKETSDISDSLRDERQLNIRKDGVRSSKSMSEILSNISNNAASNDLRSSRQSIHPNVAFQAVLSTATLKNVGLHQKIVYDSVNLNLGGSYHQLSGIFIAPVSGIYLFCTSVLSEYHAYIEVGIIKNGNQLAGAYAESGAQSSYDQGSASVAVQLNVGDEVWVENRYPADAKIHGQGLHTSFTGVLVVPM
ncbi:uncharacterized protein LOC132758928 [Ruditapes philippinarum]|uniref:uncharacterized protein LOC132758928 n=1 Tax=Ruditapes philippinarum TaxID=129788 RepID=UPI00295B2B3B|nr:uncharacterized protein LOC132758928 [Ruditapes philippinarum]